MIGVIVDALRARTSFDVQDPFEDDIGELAHEYS